MHLQRVRSPSAPSEMALQGCCCCCFEILQPRGKKISHLQCMYGSAPTVLSTLLLICLQCTHSLGGAGGFQQSLINQTFIVALL